MMKFLNQMTAFAVCISVINIGAASEFTEAAGAAKSLPNNTVCGVQPNDKIIGGTFVDFDYFTWTTLLRYDKPKGRGFYCGGVLISERYVLTAAHCVTGVDLPKSWKLSQVRLGEWNTSSEMDCFYEDCADPVQDIDVELVIVHEEYKPEDRDQQNDIALLRLSKNVQFTYVINPICLPISNELRQASFLGHDMMVAGWGIGESRSESDVKLRGFVNVVSTDDCSRTYSMLGVNVTTNQICAVKTTGRELCRVDSGGALMGQTTDGNSVVVGILSFRASPCDKPGWPAVYTRVGSYVDWILSKIQA